MTYTFKTVSASESVLKIWYRTEHKMEGFCLLVEERYKKESPLDLPVNSRKTMNQTASLRTQEDEMNESQIVPIQLLFIAELVYQTQIVYQGKHAL